MNILLHTIALEPARWTPRRVSRPLIELLPAIAAVGFRELEIYEPHLATAAEAAGIREGFQRLGLVPIVLSSYLNLNPATTTDSVLDQDISKLAERIEYYGFRKVRLFPGPGMKPEDEKAAALFMGRLERLLQRIPPVEVLLETHDGSLADDPALLVRLMGRMPANVGLLYQSTFFSREAALDQFRMQKPFIRHLHLQNRMPDGSFVTLRNGVVPWPEILGEIGDNVEATLEFVPVGIQPEETFDLEATLTQAREETEYARTLI
jgi:sugar phosphate isomerase/epimerase